MAEQDVDDLSNVGEASGTKSLELLEKKEMPTSSKIDTYLDQLSQLSTEEDKERQTSTPQSSMPIFSIFRNLIVYSFSFMLLFTSLSSFANLQSTLNLADGLGTTGLTVIYAVIVVTSLCITVFTLPLLSYKVMTIVSMMSYVSYVATGFYATWYTVIPGSVIIGFGASHLWCTQLGYMTQLGKLHADKRHLKPEVSYGLFFGIFYGFYYTSQIWGNLISSLVFEDLQTNGANGSNVSYTSTSDQCGSNFCATNAQHDNIIRQPSQHEVNIFTGICCTLSVCAVLLILFLLTNVSAPAARSEKRSVVSKVLGVLHLLVTSRDQQLLIPLTMLCGITQAFIQGDFNVAFVSCPYGVGLVGYVMVAHGVSSSLSAILSGKLVKKIGPLPVLYSGILIQIVTLIVFLLWTPSVNQKYVVFILAALWGIGDAVKRPHTQALYSVYFTSHLDAASSSFEVLSSLGSALCFGVSSWICMDVKIYIVITILVISFICLTIVRFKH